jgi:hypothetical protein
MQRWRYCSRAPLYADPRTYWSGSKLPPSLSRRVIRLQSDAEYAALRTVGSLNHKDELVTKVMLANRATEAHIIQPLLQFSHLITRKKGTLVIKAIK